MYTRCDSCQAVYPLDAEALAEAAGVVRCGNCGKTFNSLAHLFDHRPADDDEPLKGGGMPPLLDHPELVQAELPVHLAPEPDAPGPTTTANARTEAGSDDRQLSTRRLAWSLACTALIVALAVQLGFLAQTPGTPLARWLAGDETISRIDPNEAIQIVSRDMHRHPSLDDAVVVSASLRNQARHAIDFPTLEVRFYDPSQQIIGMRRLNPEEYLNDPAAVEQGMPPDVVMPLLMEFIVGASEPTGFQLRFH